MLRCHICFYNANHVFIFDCVTVFGQDRLEFDKHRTLEFLVFSTYIDPVKHKAILPINWKKKEDIYHQQKAFSKACGLTDNVPQKVVLADYSLQKILSVYHYSWLKL